MYSNWYSSKEIIHADVSTTTSVRSRQFFHYSFTLIFFCSIICFTSAHNPLQRISVFFITNPPDLNTILVYIEYGIYWVNPVRYGSSCSSIVKLAVGLYIWAKFEFNIVHTSQIGAALFSFLRSLRVLPSSNRKKRRILWNIYIISSIPSSRDTADICIRIICSSTNQGTEERINFGYRNGLPLMLWVWMVSTDYINHFVDTHFFESPRKLTTFPCSDEFHSAGVQNYELRSDAELVEFCSTLFYLWQ